MPRPPINLLLDSGAFSAWQQGIEINLDEYIHFIWSNSVENYVSLDAISVKDDLEGWEQAAQQSWNNFRRMQLKGLHPMPVFHFGERSYWLEKMLGEGGASWVGLGGVAKRKTVSKRQWLDGAFSILSKYRVNVHGFGISSFKLLEEFPFDSADSTTWMIQAAMRTVFVPRPIGTPILIDTGHSFDLGEGERKMIEKFAKANGSTWDKLTSKYWERARLNVRAMQEYEKQRTSPRQFGFFQEYKPSRQLQFYFSITADPVYAWVLEREKVQRVLLSYHRLNHVMKSLGRTFKGFLTEGLYPKPPKDWDDRHEKNRQSDVGQRGFQCVDKGKDG